MHIDVSSPDRYIVYIGLNCKGFIIIGIQRLQLMRFNGGSFPCRTCVVRSNDFYNVMVRCTLNVEIHKM